MPNIYLPGVVTIPSALQITAITKASPMVVTLATPDPVTEANTYIVGMAVKLNVPISYGMYQANNLIGTITAISGLNFTLNIDSSQFDAFVAPSGSSGVQPATISPNGSRNLEYNNKTAEVPFQSFSNIGN